MEPTRYDLVPSRRNYQTSMDLETTSTQNQWTNVSRCLTAEPTRRFALPALSNQQGRPKPSPARLLFLHKERLTELLILTILLTPLLLTPNLQHLPYPQVINLVKKGNIPPYDVRHVVNLVTSPVCAPTTSLLLKSMQ